jgi:general secretion pathway protein F
MPKFHYRALDPSGQLVTGEAEADSSRDLLSELERIGHIPIEAREARDAPGGGILRLFRAQPKTEEITETTRDLAMLLKGGVSLHEALQLLARMGGRSVVRDLMASLQRSIADGKSFAEALSQHRDVFPPIYVKMVEVAEAAGTLETTLDAIAQERSRNEALRRRLTSALTYPSFLVLAACGVFLFVLVGVIPEFERAMSGFQERIDPSARTVFAMSGFVRANLDLILGAAVLVLLGGLLVSRSRSATGALLRLIGHIPGIRTIVQYQQTVFFCSTLGSLLGSGVDITTSLRLVRDLFRDRRAAEKVDRLIAEVRQGHRLSDALAGLDLLPAYVIPILRVGEEAGELDTMSKRIGGFYEDRLERSLARLTGILGPSILILVSLIIAWLIITIITALLSVNELLL